MPQISHAGAARASLKTPAAGYVEVVVVRFLDEHPVRRRIDYFVSEEFVGEYFAGGGPK